MINGREHDWSDIKIYMSGFPISDVKNINYRDSQEVEFQYGQGRDPYGVGYGNKSAEGDMDITLEEFRKFAAPAAALGRSPYDYAPFPIVIAFADKKKKTEGDPPRDYVIQEYSPTKVHTIPNVVITDIDDSAAQNDKELLVKLSWKSSPIFRT